MKKFRLGDIANVEISGIDKKTKEGESAVRLCNFTDVYYNWAITKNMYEGLMQASASESDIETFSLCRGQVAITKDSETRDDIGVATYIADDFEDVVLGYHCALITPRTDIPEEEKIYGKYLNALLHTKYAQKYFSNNATGSGQRYTLSKEAIDDMPVYLPSYKEQVRIGDYLSDIDKKIETNNLINAELEAMAKQIYDYWFVQFDFPNEEGRPFKSSGGKLICNDTLNRNIPEGWEVVPLSSYLSTYNEKISSADVRSDDKYAPIEVLPRRKMSFNECAPIEDAVSSLCRFHKKHILLSNRRVYFHKVCVAAFDGITRDTVIVLKPSSDNLLGYAYQLVNDDVFIEYATRHSYGTEQPVLSWESAKMYNVLKPSDSIDEKYSSYMKSIIDTVLANENEIDVLLKQRAELLPLFINGQYTIKE